MNGAQLQAWVNAHKAQVALGGAAGVAGLVWWRKQHPAAAASSPAAQYSSNPATGIPYSVGAGPYDSTANDVYNSLQGVLEQLQNTADQIATNPPPSAAPVTATPPVATATPTGSGPVAVGDPILQAPDPAIHAITRVGGNTVVTQGSSPTPEQTFSHLSSFSGLPAGTALFVKNPNGSFTWLSPAEAAAQKPGTAFYVQGADNKAPR